jgi:hypothetical protein
VEWELAQALGLPLGSGEPLRYSTRLGPYDGELIRHTFELRSENAEGDQSSLEVDATIWVGRDWPGPCFIGYNGFLDHIRFAVDPAEKVFFFGNSG